MNISELVKAATYISMSTARGVYADTQMIVEPYNPVHKTGLRITAKGSHRGHPRYYAKEVLSSRERELEYDEDSLSPIYDHILQIAKKIKSGYKIGRIKDSEIPVKKGMTVKIPKGTPLRSFHPQRDGDYEAGRSYKIKVHHVFNGFTSGYGDERITYNFRVRWPGTGGYWVSADINHIEILDEDLTQ